jgi:hypothetical protein
MMPRFSNFFQIRTSLRHNSLETAYGEEMENSWVHGKIPHLDLTSGQFVVKQLHFDGARAYVGDLGVNTWLMQETYETGSDSL